MAQPIVLYGHTQGPNPWKINILLEELGVPFKTDLVDMKDMHQPPYEKINPNGRVPSITDPNTGVTLWESGAILEYLVKKYDTAGKFHYTTEPESFYTQQFLHFQMSGQGPYFGQAAWFTHFHPEKIPSAQERYKNEIKRVSKVLDGVLAANPAGVLVGDKVTYADLAFVPWYWLVPFIDQTGDLQKAIHDENPAFSKWINALNARPAVKKCFDERAKAMGQ